MSLSYPWSRIITYCKRHGFSAAVGRVVKAVNRAIFSNRMVLFYFDLSGAVCMSAELPCSIMVERTKSETELSSIDFQELINLWNPTVARRQIRNRFGQDASLWMIKVDGRLAGYGWTLRGRTIEPHFFRLGPDDVHLFDYYVAPPYRGRGLNPLMVNHILQNLATEHLGRAFIEVAEWNLPQLLSLRKTPFRLLGYARKFTLGNKTMVLWGTDCASCLAARDAIS